MKPLLLGTRLIYDAFLQWDPKKRRAGQMRLARHLARRNNTPMYPQNVIWVADKEYLDVWQGFKETDGIVVDKRFQLYQLAKMVRSLPGDTAECGVWRGAGSYLICKAHEGKSSTYQHHIFDSFEGLSEPVPQDREYVLDPERMMRQSEDEVYRYKAGDLSVGLDLVKQNLAQFDFVHYHKGWIPERFHEVEDRQFTVVHIDVDLYQPTVDALEFFYPRMVKGGVIIVDDYGWLATPGAKTSVNDFLADKPEEVAHLVTAHGLIVKQ